MPGSKSFPADAPAAEGAAPLGLAVHAVPVAQALMDSERTRRGRRTMVLVLLLCLAPVLASYFTFYVLVPRGKAYGELIHPALEMPADLALRTLEGGPLASAVLRHQWLLVVVDGGACVGECEDRLFMQRQLREMLGKERDKVDKLWLVVDDAPIPPKLLASLEATPAMRVLRSDRAALSAWLKPAAGQTLEPHLYLVDPLGRWMWRSPVRPEPQRVKRDLDKLLRAASGWDQAGRP